MGGPSKMLEYKCEVCGNVFVSRKRYDRIVRFCSRACNKLGQLGRPAHNLGVPMSDEQKAKLQHTFFKKGQTAHNKGVPMTPEQREKVKHTFFKVGQPSVLRGKTMPSRAGANNLRWKGGKSTQGGYVHVLMPDHHRAGERGYVPEQVLVAEQCLGRLLEPAEIVHHINFVKKDNRPENLYVFPSQGEHKRHHNFLRSGKEQPKVSNLPSLSV